MRETATKLKNNLSEQLNLYNYMGRLSAEKKEIIIKGVPDNLMEVDRCIEAVACRILELEQDRRKILDGHIDQDSKLGDFINKLDNKAAAPLKKVREELLKSMKEIQKINNLNVYLINNSIKWIEHSVNTITNHFVPESASYNARGKTVNRSTYDISSISTLVERDV